MLGIIIWGILSCYLSKLAFGQISLTMSKVTPSAPIYEGACQITPVDVTVVTVNITCSGALAITFKHDFTITPGGSSANCVVISTGSCTAGGLTCPFATCTQTIRLSHTGGTCALDYEAVASSSFNYIIQYRANATSGALGFASNLILIDAPVFDCNEAPYFPSVAYNSQIPEYELTPSTYSGTIGPVLARDYDSFNSTFGNVTLSIIAAMDSAGSPINQAPFYFSPLTSGVTSVDTYLVFDTSRCAVGARPTCLAYFDYSVISPKIYNITIVATDGNSLAATASYLLTIIQVFEKPVFMNVFTSTDVPETDVGVKTIYSPTAYQSNNLTVTFQIAAVSPASGSSFFAIGGSCTLSLSPPSYCRDLRLTASVVSGSLNYYAVPQFNITFWGIVYPGGSITPLTTTSWLIVNITLVNRQPVPTINSSSITIGEDQTGSYCFWTISAFDREGNPPIFDFYSSTYSTTGGQNFEVNQTTGVVCTRKVVSLGSCCNWIFNQPTEPNYTLFTSIFDQYSTQPSYTFTLTVILQYKNRPPTITSPANPVIAPIPECTGGVSTPIYTLTATDPENNTLTFSIGLPQPSNALMFTVSTLAVGPPNRQGLLSYQTPPALNYTISPLYLNLTVFDGQYTVTQSIQITVQRCDIAPRFTNLANVASINENVTGTAPFFTVSSIDVDNDIPRYFFKYPNGTLSAYFGYFLIDQTTGVVSYVIGAAAVFDAFVTPSYTLPIYLENTPTYYSASPPQISSTLVVSINIINRPPTMTRPNNTVIGNVTILENATISYTLYQLNATDREGDVLFYNYSFITHVNPAFRIPFGLNFVEFNTQYANTLPILNYNNVSEYYLKIYVWDEYTVPTSTVTLIITVVYCDKPPVWTSLPATLYVREDVTVGAELMTVGAKDINRNTTYTLTYAYLGVTPASASSIFYYNTATRAFGYNSTPGFNYQTRSAYQSAFSVTNGIFTVTSFINIVIVQRATPTAVAGTYNATVSVSESQTLAVQIWDLRTTDNSSLLLTYNLVSVAPATSIFTVTQDGFVKIQSNPGLDYQKIKKYELTLTVVNNNLPPKTTTYSLTVSVLDTTSAPYFTNVPNSLTLTEGYASTANIFTPICIDVDANLLTYSSTIMPPAAVGLLNVNPSSGTVSTIGGTQLVYQNTPSIYLVLYCTNNVYTVSATLTVNLQFTQFWSNTQSTTTPTTTTVLSTTTTAECANCLTSTQIGAIAGSIGGALCLAGIAYGLAKVMQGQAAANGALQAARPVNPPPYFNKNI